MAKYPINVEIQLCLGRIQEIRSGMKRIEDFDFNRLGCSDSSLSAAERKFRALANYQHNLQLELNRLKKLQRKRLWMEMIRTWFGLKTE